MIDRVSILNYRTRLRDEAIRTHDYIVEKAEPYLIYPIAAAHLVKLGIQATVRVLKKQMIIYMSEEEFKQAIIAGCFTSRRQLHKLRGVMNETT